METECDGLLACLSLSVRLCHKCARVGMYLICRLEL